jgi:AmpD protein
VSARAWHDGWWHRARRCESPNQGARPDGTAIELVVLHSISLPPGVFGGDDVERFFLNRLDHAAHPYYDQLRDMKVSAHFLLRRTGEAVQFVSCDRRAWHAGRSSWLGRDNCNDWSVGIELEGLEGGEFEAAQYRTLASLLRSFRRSHPLVQVVGHEHVAPLRKQDPGPGFDWARLRRDLRWPAPMFPIAPDSRAALASTVKR